MSANGASQNGGSAPRDDYDYDYVVIGSGFGGSVSALRLAEKGYSVAVLECGRRYGDDDFPSSSWRLRDTYWFPKLGLKGLWRLTFFKDVAILSGSGVGGGSLVYANTLYRAGDPFREALDGACGEHVDLDAHYDVAERMLGVVTHPRVTAVDQIAIDTATELGYGDSFQPTKVGVFFGEADVRVPDPFFDGEGPERTGCNECGRCMLGCPYGAKNMLTKNYLWFAERLGVTVQPERMVVDVRPLGSADGGDGYTVTSVRSGSHLRRERRTLRARGVVLAAGALGTNSLLANCRASGALPNVSERLGSAVRTTSESVCAVTARDRDADFTGSIAITGSLFPNEHTHIETVSYGEAGDTVAANMTLLTADGTRLTRPLKLVANILRHPRDFARTLNLRNRSRRTIWAFAMQPVDNAVALEPKRRMLGRGVRLQTRQDAQNPIPTFIPELHEFVERTAERLDAVPQSWNTEALANIPVTAHILGGAVVATNPADGVIDPRHEVFGYRNLLVCDGSAVPFNPGVNPSLTITAMCERAMSFVPPKPGASTRRPVGIAASQPQASAAE